jgi:hypothetical protein
MTSSSARHPPGWRADCCSDSSNRIGRQIVLIYVGKVAAKTCRTDRPARRPRLGGGPIAIPVRQRPSSSRSRFSTLPRPPARPLVKQTVAELLEHPPECACGKCEAAAVARPVHIYLIASAWERATAATRRRAAR